MDGFKFLKASAPLGRELKQPVIIALLTTSLNPKDVEKIEQARITGFRGN